MKPHPRIRRTIKWGGLALCLLLAGVWVRSEQGIAGYSLGFAVVAWYKGVVAIASGPDARGCAIALDMILHSDMLSRACPQLLPLSEGSLWTVPLWMPLAGTLLATVAAWRLDALARRRARAGLCRKCRYDRAGLATSAVCPECGTGGA